jgi:uncharacterized protein YdhG (YjbR/CyaY superfamily)
MKKTQAPPAAATIDAYVLGFPPAVQKNLIQFPVDEPIPFALIGKLAAIRVKESSDGTPPKKQRAAAKQPKSARKAAKKSSKRRTTKRKLPGR